MQRLDYLLPRDSEQLLNQRGALFTGHPDLFGVMQQAAVGPADRQ
jgi:hypothetical protein